MKKDAPLMCFDGLRNITSSFINKYAILSLLSILTHQSLIAFSVFASVKLINALGEESSTENTFSFWLVLYLLSMITPHIIACISDILKEKWVVNVCDIFWQSSRANYTKSTQPNNKSETLGVLTSQGKEIILEFINYISFGFSSFLNFSLSLIAILIFIDPRFIISITICILGTIIIKFLLSNKLEHLALSKSESGSKLTTLLSLTHDNMHHGSRASYSFFIEKSNDRIKKYLSKRMIERKFQSLVMLIVSLLSLLPTSFLVLFILLQEDVNADIKLAIVINLTRIYHLLNSATEVISIVISFSSYKGRLKILECFNINPIKTKYNYKNRIEIYKNNKIVDIEKVTPNLLGRLSLTGKNGSGKSTFLKQFRDENDAIYFNPSFKVMYPWEKDAPINLSDGQYSKHCVLWLLSNTDGPLLLDEWDAFLDIENCKELNKKIEEAAKSRLIIEVRQ